MSGQDRPVDYWPAYYGNLHDGRPTLAQLAEAGTEEPAS